MSRTLGSTDDPARTTAAATRPRPPGWRDPRLWAGVVIVALSVVAGARLVGAADDSVTVWAAAGPLAPGQPLAPEDLVATRVRFDAGDDLARYLATDTALPTDAVAVTGVAEGELVPRSALGAAEDVDTIDVSVSIPGEQLATTIGTGSVVDVYLLSSPGAQARAEKVLEDVVVIAAPAPAEQLGAVGAGRQLVLSVPAEQESEIGAVLSAVRDDRIRVTRQPLADPEAR